MFRILAARNPAALRTQRPRLLSFTISAALLGLAGCGGDPEPPSVAGCDLQAPACGNDLVCTEQPDGSGLCQLPAGAACDASAQQPNCRVGSACLPVADMEAGGPEYACLVVRGETCDPLEPYCADKLTCAEVSDDGHRCFAKVLVRGSVLDAADLSPLAGAHVIAIDEEGVAATDVVSSSDDGGYTLELPVARAEDGTPLDATFTLRAAAQDFQTFPGGLRTALPLHTNDAKDSDEAFVIMGTNTDITLIALPGDSANRHVIAGHLGSADGSDDVATRAALAGVLIVAAGASTQTALTDRSGDFTLFNVGDGSHVLKGYAAGVDVTPLDVEVADQDVVDVALSAELATLARVSGKVDLANAPGVEGTSVILVVEETFDPVFGRGDVPRGLRSPRTGEPNVTGSFAIDDVPEGRYVVLAGFENDMAVRDPDTNISGTEIVHIQVDGADMEVGQSFKVTDALAVIAPGAEAPEAMSQAPMLTWADDSSEQWYEVLVYNAFGEEVWRLDRVEAEKGSATVSVAYGGPMEVGMYYQFRVTSWRAPGGRSPSPIASTEDLRGVFYVMP